MGPILGAAAAPMRPRGPAAVFTDASVDPRTARARRPGALVPSRRQAAGEGWGLAMPLYRSSSRSRPLLNWPAVRFSSRRTPSFRSAR